MAVKDRTRVLQKAQMLRGSNILISEDFPKNILKKREQLVKFAKEVRGLVFVWNGVMRSEFYLTMTACSASTIFSVRYGREGQILA